MAQETLPPDLAVREWFERERGITQETLDAFDVSVEESEKHGPTAVFYYPGGNKYRSIGSDRHFWTDDGFKLSPFYHRYAEKPSSVAFICEGETDTMRLWQELGGTTDVVGLPGVQSWRSDWASGFDAYESVYVILDNDGNYGEGKVAAAAAVESSWLKIRRDLGVKARRVKLPHGVKDVCEFFQKGYTADDLRTIVMRPISRYKALDLTNAHKPRPVNWLVEGLIGQGDLCLLFGESGVGKSWLTMSLALGIIQGWDRWLGRRLHPKTGRVLYVDEENPEDVILDRLYKLGLHDADSEHFRFIHEQGVRLDKEPDALLEEAVNFTPDLIVLDSFTRFHTANENDAGAVASLYNDAIKPLARETGATVALLHHARKSGYDESSFNRARGSGDITASVDTGLEVQKMGSGYMKVIHFKSRRRLPDTPTIVQIEDMDNGGVQLSPRGQAPAPLV